MKKLFVLATAAFLVTGVSFAHGGDKKKDTKTEKACCKGGGKECKKDEKDVKSTATKTATKPATKKA